MSQFSFKMSRALFNSLRIGDTLVDTVTRIVWTIVDIDYSYDRRQIHKIINRTGDSLTFSQCLEYHYNKEVYS